MDLAAEPAPQGRPCRVCKVSTDLLAYRVRHGDHICRPCRTAVNAKYVEHRRLRKLAERRERRGAGLPSNPDDPVKRTTRRRSLKLVSWGLLEKTSCRACGDPRVEAHHPDYRDPLTVVWLCLLHHAAHHSGKLDLSPSWITRAAAPAAVDLA